MQVSSEFASESSVDTQALSAAQALSKQLATRLNAAIKGREEVVELILIALLADGHVLLEDYPGSGKTTLARALGEGILEDAAQTGFAAFRRIQFTPDLLPSDVTGTTVFDMERNSFKFRPGPLFAHVVLADEINRTSPKVQAAMLEAMAEKQITVDNQTYPLDALFFVIATQNPLDVAGTYPLPTPQLDRFLFKIRMSHVSREAELKVLEDYPKSSLDIAATQAKVTRHDLIAARTVVRAKVHVADPIKAALVDLARSLRSDTRVLQGVSTRALVLMLPALQARAVIHGRDFVSPDDIAALSPHVFSHRMECAPGVDDTMGIIRDALGTQLDKLAKLSLKR